MSPQRRLQRPADFTGEPLRHYRQVVLRHGLPFLLIGIALLFVPGLLASTSTATRFPLEYYGIAAIVTSLAMLGWSWVLEKRITLIHVSWIFYLLGVSIWEEWVFRVAIPNLLVSSDVVYLGAIITSNLIFGAIHYFTLRWKALWCVLAFLGGMGLSRNFSEHGDLLFIIGLHWVVTFANTPRPPSRSESKS